MFGEGPTKGPNNSQAKNSDIQTFTAGDIRFTVPKADTSTVYATALGWPASGALLIQLLGSTLPYLKRRVCSVSLLGTTGELAFMQKAEGLFISLPVVRPDEVAYVFRIRTGCAHGTR